MIEIRLDNPRHSALWKQFKEADVRDAQSDPRSSLLRGLLHAASATDEVAGELLLLVDWLAAAMERFWTDPTQQHPVIRKKDISHNRRLLFYLERFLFPVGIDFAPERRVKPIHQIDLYDAFVLLVAAYLHDYGKGQHLLVIPELEDEDVIAVLLNAAGPANLPPEAHSILEDHHSLVISQFLQVFLDAPDPYELRRELDRRYDSPSRGRLARLIESGRHRLGEETYDVGDKLEVHDANEAERRVWWVLCKIARLGAPEGRRLLEEIQVVCRSHKAYKKPGDETPTDFFLQIESPHHKRLAALLRLADNLDLSRERLELDEGGLLLAAYRHFLSDTGDTTPEREKPLQRIFEKWTMFALLEGVRIEHDLWTPPGEISQITVRVILRYYRFPFLHLHLLTLRKQVEKDFQQTEYLHALCSRGTNPSVRLQLLYEVVLDAPEESRGGACLPQTEPKLREIFGRAEKGESKPELHPFSFLPPADTRGALAFSPLPDDLDLPTNRDLLYLLHFLRRNGRTQSETIAAELGIPRLAKLYEDPQTATSPLIKADSNDHRVEIRDDWVAKVGRLVDALEEQPSLVRQKIREIERFGHLLPFSSRQYNLLHTGVDGLDKILGVGGGGGLAGPGIHHARNVLIVGGPGTGKTTLALHILHHNLQELGRDVLMLTFEELDSTVAANCFEDFGWRHVAAFLRNIRLNAAGGEEGGARTAEQIVAEMNEAIQKEDPEIVAIDSLSRLRWEDGSDRKVIDALLRSFKIRGISSICSLEEKSSTVAEEEYQADGVIRLTQDGDKRELLIEKLRNQGYARGNHPFEILDRMTCSSRIAMRGEASSSWPLKPGVNVYPNEQYYAVVATMQPDPPAELETTYISTGVKNLDALLPGASPTSRGGYRRGNAILALGSPGAGKTLFGLHFLNSSDFDGKKDTAVLWLSFEGPMRLLRRSVESFDAEAGFDRLLGQTGFLFLYVPLALISPEKVLYLLDELIRARGIRRVVVDSVSEIEEAFREDKLRFRRYMMTLIDTMARRHVTSMFLYRVPGFFDTVKESQSDISTLVDTIIAIKTFDMKNEIRRGLFVLKSRGREQRSQLQTMEIDSKNGITVSYKGWEMEGLLSGQTGSIHEPEVFLKHFYENPAEREINVALVEEFRRRYAEKGRFTEVRKPAIYSEFWSFKGHHGAGHANIRIVSISRYMVTAFRDLGRLHELQDFFPETLSNQIQKDVRWSRYSHQGNVYHAIPMYTDLGVLAARKDLAFELFAVLPDLATDDLFTLATTQAMDLDPKELAWPELKKIGRLSFKKEISWADLVAFSRQVGACRTTRLPYVFALPSLYHMTEFMAFFFEILWSMGGDVYHFPVFRGSARERDGFYKENILGNRCLWQRLLGILEQAGDGDTWAIYKADTMVARLSGFLDFLDDLARKSDAQPDGGAAVDHDESHRSTLKRVCDAVKTLILDSGRASIQDRDVLTVDNRYFRNALEFLYDLVFDSNGAIPNPCDGDSRDEAVFSRCWYSQLQGARDRLVAARTPEALSKLAEEEKAREKDYEKEVRSLVEGHIELLPIPYFIDGERRRCCSMEAEWCISVVKQALSPEIGWIYIDTLTSTDWVERRARQRRGFPFRREEMVSMKRYDPGAYALLEEIMNTKNAKDQVLEAERELVVDRDDEGEEGRVNTAVESFFKGRYHLRDVGDVLRALSAEPHSERRRRFLERLRQEETAGRVQVPEWFSSDGAFPGEHRISELSDFEVSPDPPGLARRSKIPAHRPYFHQVERTLHEEIVKLFSVDGRREWFTLLTGERHEEDPEVIEEYLGAVRRRERQTRKAESGGRTEAEQAPRFLSRALERMRDRLIFDLLTTVTSDHDKCLNPRPPGSSSADT